jgi:hypothetical protein
MYERTNQYEKYEKFPRVREVAVQSPMAPVVLVCARAEERSAWPDAETVCTRILLLMCAARARRAMQDQPAHRGTFQALDHELLSLCARAVSVTLTFSPWRHIAPVRYPPIGDSRAGLLHYVTHRRFERALDALESYVACGGSWNDKLALLWPELFRRRPALPHVAFINELGRAPWGDRGITCLHHPRRSTRRTSTSRATARLLP